MKKGKSKIKLLLSLDRETIVKLDDSQLGAIAGGETSPVSSCALFTCNPDNCAQENNDPKNNNGQ